jgi:hypothetical protein
VEEARHVGADDPLPKVLDNEGDIFSYASSTLLKVAGRDVGVNADICRDELSWFLIPWGMHEEADTSISTFERRDLEIVKFLDK